MLSTYLKKINKLGFIKNVTKKTDNLLTNVYVLYFVSVIALLDLFYLIMSSEFTFVAIFILIGFLTTFFSKNMIVVLCIAAAVTNVVKYGSSAGIKREGLSNKEEDEPTVDSSNNVVEPNEVEPNEVDPNEVKSNDVEHNSDVNTPVDHKEIAKKMLELSKKENMENKAVLNDPKAYSDVSDDTALLNKQAQKLLLEAEKLTEQHNIILEKMQNIGNSAIGGFLGIAASGDKK
jgi:hypothetical protein